MREQYYIFIVIYVTLLNALIHIFASQTATNLNVYYCVERVEWISMNLHEAFFEPS